MNKEKSNQINCSYNNFKRARYFHGMLMTDRDFREEQTYHNDKRKLLNKMLHGWGVVCGLEIKPIPNSRTVVIKSGLALDCKGNEIYVSEEYPLNIEKILKSGSVPKGPGICSTEKGVTVRKLYIIIRYKEIYTDQVPIYAPGGGCEEKTCENSRIREGYCIELVNQINPKCCPTPLRNPGDMENPCKNLLDKEESEEVKEKIRTFLCEDFLMPCPGDCCDDAYVVLGSINLTMITGSDTEFEQIESSMINNWDCRSYVMSFGLLQHWMTLLAPQKVPFETIVDYTRLGYACKSKESAVAAFRDICQEKDTLEYKKYSVYQQKKNDRKGRIMC